ncbi:MULTISPECIES: LrgB family protein [Fusobacterium]|jgi:predicted murein hydrolase (TIGR00659 family)|uniref:LrgB family protein n=1 Tax=Fusobacterium hominis TaxID=2764326 RepID=A0A7G9GZ37_9FUSO|nr:MULTISPECIES: LrgB family protein [Fusobacterium]QNM16069.1 LrgB family protein [Fusobacterium hominis]
MKEILGQVTNTPLFGVIISLVAFEIGMFIFKKTKLAIFNPLLIATIIVMGFLHFTGVEVKNYMLGANFVVFFLAPATVVLAVPLFQKIDLLKKYFIPIIGGGIIGAITAIVSVVIIGKLLGIDHNLLLSFMPKSITTPIGIEVSRMLGGIPSITVFAIIITGITGNVAAPFIYSVFRVKHPVAKGLGLGISSHAVGTSRAIEMGEIEGAMSALSIVIAGILTLALAPIVKMVL